MQTSARISSYLETLKTKRIRQTVFRRGGNKKLLLVPIRRYNMYIHFDRHAGDAGRENTGVPKSVVLKHSKAVFYFVVYVLHGQ